MSPNLILTAAFIPLLCAATIFICTGSTRNSMKAFIILIPLQAFGALEAGFTIPPSYLLLLCLIIGIIAKGELKPANAPGSRLVLAYLGIAVVSTVVAAVWLNTPSVQFDEWMRYRAGSLRSPLQLALTIFHFVPFFLFAMVVSRTGEGASFLKVHLWTGFILCCAGIYQISAYALNLPLQDFTWSFNLVSNSSTYTYGQVHAYGAGVTDFATRTTFRETRFFADYLLSVIPISMALWLSRSQTVRDRWGFLASPAFSIIGIITVFLTMSRSAWVILALTFLFMAVWLSPRILFRQAPIAIILTAVAAALLVKLGFFSDGATSFGSIITSRLSVEGLINDPRVPYFIVLWDVFLSNPVLGVGAGNFSVFSAAALGANVLISAHGILFEALAEFGLLGFLTLLSSFLVVMIALGRGIRQTESKADRAVMVGLLCSFFALFLNGFTGFDRPPFHYVFIMGMCAAYALRYNTKKADDAAIQSQDTAGSTSKLPVSRIHLNPGF